MPAAGVLHRRAQDFRAGPGARGARSHPIPAVVIMPTPAALAGASGKATGAWASLTLRRWLQRLHDLGLLGFLLGRRAWCGHTRPSRGPWSWTSACYSSMAGGGATWRA